MSPTRSPQLKLRLDGDPLLAGSARAGAPGQAHHTFSGAGHGHQRLGRFVVAAGTMLVILGIFVFMRSRRSG